MYKKGINLISIKPTFANVTFFVLDLIGLQKNHLADIAVESFVDRLHLIHATLSLFSLRILLENRILC
jgi:hypothetical protein